MNWSLFAASGSMETGSGPLVADGAEELDAVLSNVAALGRSRDHGMHMCGGPRATSPSWEGADHAHGRDHD
jgi:hypothetical protein